MDSKSLWQPSTTVVTRATLVSVLVLFTLAVSIREVTADCPRNPAYRYFNPTFAEIDPQKRLPIVPARRWVRSTPDPGRPMTPRVGLDLLDELESSEGWTIHSTLSSQEYLSLQRIEIFSNEESITLDDIRQLFSAFGAIPVVTHSEAGFLTRVYLSVFPDLVFASGENGPVVVLHRDRWTQNYDLLRWFPEIVGPRSGTQHLLNEKRVYVLQPDNGYACEWSYRTRPMRQLLLFLDEDLNPNPSLTPTVRHDQYWYLETELAFVRNTSHLEAFSSTPMSTNMCRCPHYTGSYSLQSSRLKEAVEGAEWACQFSCRPAPGEFGDFESLSFLRMFSVSEGRTPETEP